MKDNITILVCVTCVAMSSYLAGKSNEKRAQQKTQKKSITKVIIANTDIMKESEAVFKQLKKNSDTLMRYSHYLDGHDPAVKKHLLCPECFKDVPAPKGAEKYFITEFEDHPEEVPETFDQLERDCKELRNSMKTISNSLHGQSVTISIALEKVSDDKFAENFLFFDKFNKVLEKGKYAK